MLSKSTMSNCRVSPTKHSVHINTQVTQAVQNGLAPSKGFDHGLESLKDLGHEFGLPFPGAQDRVTKILAIISR